MKGLGRHEVSVQHGSLRQKLSLAALWCFQRTKFRISSWNPMNSKWIPNEFFWSMSPSIAERSSMVRFGLMFAWSTRSFVACPLGAQSTWANLGRCSMFFTCKNRGDGVAFGWTVFAFDGFDFWWSLRFYYVLLCILLQWSLLVRYNVTVCYSMFPCSLLLKTSYWTGIVWFNPFQSTGNSFVRKSTERLWKSFWSASALGWVRDT